MDAPVLTAFSVTFAAGLATLFGWLAVVRGNTANPRLLAFGLAFAAGAMVYVSLAEIFVKAQDSFAAAAWFGGQTQGSYGLATLMLFLGMGLVIVLDRFVPNPHGRLQAQGGTSPDPLVARAGLLAAAAITAHNVPEGLATFFATLDDPSVGSSLAVAIAIHNVPEGVTIALPIFYATGSRAQAFLWTLISALAEPSGALLGYAVLGPFLNDMVFGIVFGLIAGAMVFLSLDELLPTAKRYAKGHETVYGMVIGMALLATSLVLFR